MGLIYKITNTINEKVYVGQTKREFEVRRAEYFYADKMELYDTIIYRAFKKYGIEKFCFSVVEDDIEESMLDEREILYIMEHNALAPHGYNILQGGVVAGTQSMGWSRSKAVYQIDPESFKIIGSAESLTDMFILTGITVNNISQSCHKKTYSAKGFIFRFQNDFDMNEVKEHYGRRPGKPIRCYKEFTKEDLGDFHSISEAAKALGLNTSSVSSNCNKDRKHSGKIDKENVICEFTRKSDIDAVFYAAPTPKIVKNPKMVQDAIDAFAQKMIDKFGDE